MNDDPPAASDPARLPSTYDDDGEGEDNAGEGSSLSQDAHHHEPRRSRSGRRRSSSKIRSAKAGIAKKLDFMTHLMSSLDVIIFAELCILYYMEYGLILLHTPDFPR